MSKMMQQLETQGCDMVGAMDRFLNDEEFYRTCFKQVMEDENFHKLRIALEKSNLQEAFQAAHALKGVVGNMGLIPMVHILDDIVEPLRNNCCEGITNKYFDLIHLQEKYLELL